MKLLDDQRIMRNFILILLLIFSLPDEAVGQKSDFKTFEFPESKRFKEIDLIFAKRRDPDKSQQALELYRKEFKKTPNDPEAAWKLSMACYHLGNRVIPETERLKLKKIHQEGWDAAVAGYKADPKCAACYFWAAVNMSLYGQASSAIKILFMMSDIKKNIRKSIELDPTYLYGGGYRLLAQLAHRMPGIFGGDNNEARKYYELALQYGPNEPMNYMFFMQLLQENKSTLNEAIDVAKKGISITGLTEDRIESIDAVRDMKTFLRSQNVKIQ